MTRKTQGLALLLLGLALGRCSSLPFLREQGAEKNIAFRLINNQIVVEGRVAGRDGTFAVSTGRSETVIASGFASPGRVQVELADGRFASVVNAREENLNSPYDGILGNDVWGDHVLFIDYAKQLLSIDRKGDIPEASRSRFVFGELPSMQISVGGRALNAVTDTFFPGALLMNSEPASRVAISVNGRSVGTHEVDAARVPAAHVGNLILARYLVAIDYRRRVLFLWEDPRFFRQASAEGLLKR